MTAEIKQIIESGKLEAYVLGDLPQSEVSQVLSYIAQHAEVSAHYQALQIELQQMVLAMSRPAPADLRATIMQEISDVPPTLVESPKRTPWFCIAAGLMALILGGLSIYQYQQIGALSKTVSEAQDQIDQLQSDYQSQTLIMTSMQEQLDLVNDPATQRIILKGNDRAPLFETVTYWNAEQRTSLLQISQLSPLPSNQCYQMWADVDGEMLSLGVIPRDTGQLLSWNFLDNAESLNVTIEPQGGSEHPNVSQLVASVSI